MKTNRTVSKHPFEPYIPEGSTKLIIGTIPPHRFCVKSIDDDDVNFYYGSKDNGFYKLISEVTGEIFRFNNSEEAIYDRKSFLQKHQMGIADMVEECERKNKSSLDKDLSNIKYRDIKTLLANNPDIDTLLCTSIEARKMIYRSMGSKVENEFIKTDEKKYFKIKIGEKLYNVIELYSPSRRACRKGISEKRFEQYKAHFSKK